MSEHNRTEVYLDTAELAQRWHQCVETIRRRMRKRELPSVLIGRKRLIALRDVEAIERAGHIPAK